MLKVFWLRLVIVLSGLGLLGCESLFNAPLKVAVVLDIERTWDLSTMEWAKDNINSGGGVLGVRPIELVYFQANSESQLNSILREIGDDPEIVAVIGPATAEQSVDAGRRFGSSDTVMVTPTSTASELYRKFGENDFVWRTVESDIALTEKMVLSAWASNANKVGLLSTFSLYGSTFFDWFGFLAVEVGYPTDDIYLGRYGEDGSDAATDCVDPVDELLANQPDVLFAVAEKPEQIVCIVQAVNNFNATNGTNIRLSFSGQGYRSDVFAELGSLAEGVEGMAPMPPADNGFALEYELRNSGKDLPPYAANLYDAVLLLAYGLEHSGGRGGAPLAASLKEVVSYRGEPVGWDKSGVKDALLGIRENRRPNITGATGTLTFEDQFFTDLKESTYGSWRFENGRMVVTAYYSTGDNSVRSRSTAAIFEARASLGAQQDISFGDVTRPVGPQEDLWAFIISVSKDYSNYRHESDALRQYRILRDRGITDDRIIFAIADDIATHPNNLEPGVIRNQVDGTNLYADIEIDYRVEDISKELILAVLSGDTQEGRYPHVIESNSTSNVYVYMVGHGGPAGVAVGGGTAESAFGSEGEDVGFLNPQVFRQTLCDMQLRQAYRRALIVIESCFSGVMGEALATGCGEIEAVPDVIRVSEEAPGDNCLLGGQRLDIGPDEDGDFIPDSVTETEFSCTDETGEGMVAVASAISDENECSACPIGGIRYGSGNDIDDSGWLSDEEINYLGCVCEKDSTAKLNDVLMMTAANSSENSLSYEYDASLDVWLADQFSYKLAAAMSSGETYSLYDLYNEIYLSVSGSHVSLYNSQYFGDVREVNLEEFMRKED